MFRLLPLLISAAHAFSVPPLRQRTAALAHAHISLLQVGSKKGAAFGSSNAPLSLIEASAGGEGTLLKTLALSVTGFSAHATGGAGAALTPNAALTSVSLVGLDARPGTASARALGPVDAMVCTVEYEGGEAACIRLAPGAVTTTSGAPLSAAPALNDADVDGSGGGFYLSFANAGAPLMWVSGARDAEPATVTFGIPRCAFLAPRVFEPAQLIFWASGGGCGGGVGLSACNPAPSPF